jgi:hypothetical protein
MKNAITDLLAIVAKLQRTYPTRRFTLDGRLVGDIGEVLSCELYQITLLDSSASRYDAVTSNDWHVQIKTTMQNSLTFPSDFTPDYYLGIKVHQDGTVEEIYNGPGDRIKNEILNNRRSVPKNHLHSISIQRLQELNSQIPGAMKIERRASTGA